MKPWVIVLGLLVGGAAVATNTSAQAEPIPGYVLIGEDPAGDFSYKLAEQGDPSGLFGTGKIDIIRLDARFDGDALNLRMTLPGTTSYGGLGNHMWVVQFDVGGTNYEACWTILTAGTSAASNDVAENARGCSMFGGEDAGPREKGAGLRVVQEEETWYIEWPIPVDSIGGVGATMENIVATTWARTGDTDDGPAEYQFDLHDVAPDEGGWTYVIGAAGAATEAPFDLTLSANNTDATVDAGSRAQFAVTLAVLGNATGSANISVAGLSENFTVEAPSSLDLNGTGNHSFDVWIAAPESAANTTHTFTVNATAPGNVTASLNLTLSVGPPAAIIEGNATAQPSDVNATNEAAGLPAPSGIMAAAVVGLGALAVARRRRGTDL